MFVCLFVRSFVRFVLFVPLNICLFAISCHCRLLFVVRCLLWFVVVGVVVVAAIIIVVVLDHDAVVTIWSC